MPCNTPGCPGRLEGEAPSCPNPEKTGTGCPHGSRRQSPSNPSAAGPAAEDKSQPNNNNCHRIVNGSDSDIRSIPGHCQQHQSIEAMHSATSTSDRHRLDAIVGGSQVYAGRDSKDEGSPHAHVMVKVAALMGGTHLRSQEVECWLPALMNVDPWWQEAADGKVPAFAAPRVPKNPRA